VQVFHRTAEVGKGKECANSGGEAFHAPTLLRHRMMGGPGIPRPSARPRHPGAFVPSPVANGISTPYPNQLKPAIVVYFASPRSGFIESLLPLC